MIHRFHNIINISSLIWIDIYGICLKNIPSLVLCKFASFYTVGVVAEFYLRQVVEAAFEFHAFFFLQKRKEIRFHNQSIAYCMCLHYRCFMVL